MDRPVGRITYTQMLNQRGGIECDFTVTRLAEERFWIVTGTAFGNHDLGWIRRHAPDDGSVEVRDLTSARACLGIWGPAAREIVGSLTDDDLSNDAFPYLTAAPDQRRQRPGHWRCASPTSASSAGSCTARPSSACRCGTPSGRRAGRTACGPGGIGPSTACDWRRATGCGRPTSRRRTRRTRPAWASRCGWTRPAASSGRRHWRQPATWSDRRLCCLVLDDPLAVALGNEPIRIGGEVVGRVTSGGYGYAVGTQHRLRLPAAYGAPRSASAARWRSSASGWARRSRPSRSTTRRARASGPDARLAVSAVPATPRPAPGRPRRSQRWPP